MKEKALLIEERVIGWGHQNKGKVGRGGYFRARPGGGEDGVGLGYEAVDRYPMSMAKFHVKDTMKAKSFSVVLVAFLALGAVQQAAAQVLTNHAFDLVLQGDDPGEVFNFTFPFDPQAPSRVTFDGFFENLDGTGTGVNYYLSWSDANRIVLLSSGGFVPLASFGRLPVSFDQSAGFTPTAAFVHIEGGGPSDHFRFVGEFAIQQVPEPSAFALLGVAAVVGWWRYLCRRGRR